jgi:hypothetical protein
MSVYEVSKGSFFRRDENTDIRNNLLIKLQQLEEMLVRLDKQRQTLSMECDNVRS